MADKKRLTIDIDEKTHNEAKSKAYLEGATLKEKITELILKWLRG